MESLKKLSLVLSAAFAALFLLYSSVHADVRDYLVTYPYGTPYKGEWELELWNDFNSDKDNTDLTYNRHQIEIEHGITDRYMAGFYLVFFKRGDTAKLEEIKLEQRYRLANKGEFIFDPALYIEYRDRNASGKKNILEGKFIISKDIGKLNFTSNLIWEKKLASGEPWEFEYTLAVSHPISKSTNIGVEYFAQPVDNRAYLIPGIYTQFSPKVRLNIGPAFGLTTQSIDFGIRSIFSWEF